MVRLQLDSIAQEAMDLNLAKEGYTAFYVDGTNGRDNYPGDSWEQPFKTIQHAVDEAESWTKIFIKAGTYTENVVVTKYGLSLLGEGKSVVVVSPSAGSAIYLNADRGYVTGLTAKSGTGSYPASIEVNGADHCEIYDVLLEENGGTLPYGTLVDRGATSSRFTVINRVLALASGLSYGIYAKGYSKYTEIVNCVTETGSNGISLGTYSTYGIIRECEVIGGTYGITIRGDSDHNTIFHNNIQGASIANSWWNTTGTDNEATENFYDDHIVDSNNDGLCDTPYTFTGGTDYQPVSRRNGWEQESLGYDSATTNSLVFKGTVTTATDATHFASTDLIGHGNDALKDWYIYVFYDTAGTDAAPQGEQQPITDYVSSTGTFTHTAFTADLAVGDEVLIMHPYEATGGDATEAKQDTIISGQEGGVNDVNWVAGKTQIFEKSITSAANAGNVLVGTITAQPCLIKSVVVHANATGQADLTSAGVYGGDDIATHTITFLSATDAAKTNIDVADEQVAWTGVARLAATKVIAIELLGTGATTVDLTVVVECVATVNGGYLV